MNRSPSSSTTMILITLIAWKTSWQKIHLILQCAAVHLILQNMQKTDTVSMWIKRIWIRQKHFCIMQSISKNHCSLQKQKRSPYHRNLICFFLLFASAIRLYPSTIFSFSPFTMERACFISTSFSRSDGSCASTPGMTMHFRFAAS